MFSHLPTYLRQLENDLELTVRVVPKASRTRFMDPQGDALKLTITAPPVDGAANQAVVKFLSDFCDVSKSMIYMKSGQTSRTKTFVIRGGNADKFLEKLNREK